jgi:L-amino acid N-acyltransferase YncA
MTLCLRFATPDDAAACLKIYSPIVSDTTISFELDPPSIDTMRERIEAKQQSFPWLVAEKVDGDSVTVVGYAYAGQWRERQAYRWTVELAVYVAPSSQRAGVGKLLYTNLIALLRVQRFANAIAVISLPNDASIAFHHRLGFKTIGVFPRVGCKFDRWLDVAFLQLDLCQTHANAAPQPPLSVAESQLGWKQIIDDANANASGGFSATQA